MKARIDTQTGELLSVGEGRRPGDPTSVTLVEAPMGPIDDIRFYRIGPSGSVQRKEAGEIKAILEDERRAGEVVDERRNNLKALFDGPPPSTTEELTAALGLLMAVLTDRGVFDD